MPTQCCLLSLTLVLPNSTCDWSISNGMNLAPSMLQGLFPLNAPSMASGFLRGDQPGQGYGHVLRQGATSPP